MTRKIGIVLPSLSGGGAEKVMTLLAEGLTEYSHHEVTLVICADRQSESFYTVPEQVEVVRFARKHVFQSVFDLMRLFQQKKFDIVVTALEHVAVITAFALFVSPVKSAFFPTVHNTISITLRSSTRWTDRMTWFLAKKIYRCLPLLGVVSSGIAQDVQDTMGIPAVKIRVLYNPVVRQQQISPVQNTISIPSNAILAIGRLEPEKGFDVLVKAYAILSGVIENPVYIIGEGSQRPVLEQLIRDHHLENRIHLTGYLPEAASLMTQAELFVLSSRVEGLPTVLIEALAAGIPIVSTDCRSGPREILSDGEYGMLVPVNNPELLAEGILKQLSKPHSRLENQQRARDFSIESSVNAYCLAFDELLSSWKN